MTTPNVLLINPSGGRGKVLRYEAELRRLAGETGARVEVSHDAADVTRVAREAAEAGAARFVVAGGDGTVHHAVQALAGTGCALGIVPLGSGNDLARVLGLPREPEAAFRVATEGAVRQIDVGRAGEALFAGVASFGLDGEATRFAAERTRRLRGSLLYGYAALRVLGRFAPFEARVRYDGESFEGRVMLVAVANSGRYGSGMRIAPEARIDDGLLDLVIVREVSRPELLLWFGRVFGGTHVRHPAVVLARAARVEVSTERPMTISADGEVLARTGREPVAVEALTRALLVAAG